MMDEADVRALAAKDLIAQIRAMAPDETTTTPRSRGWASRSSTTRRGAGRDVPEVPRAAGMDMTALGKARAARKTS